MQRQKKEATYEMLRALWLCRPANHETNGRSIIGDVRLGGRARVNVDINRGDGSGQGGQSKKGGGEKLHFDCWCLSFVNGMVLIKFSSVVESRKGEGRAIFMLLTWFRSGVSGRGLSCVVGLRLIAT